MFNPAAFWEPIKILTAIIGSVIVYIQYDAHQEEQRINRANDYVRLYQIQYISDAHFERDPAVEHLAQIITDSKSTPVPSKIQYPMIREPVVNGEALWASIAAFADRTNATKTAGDGTKSIENLHTLKLVFRPVANCAMSHACDIGILCKSFFGDMQFFDQQYREVYKSLGNEWLDAELFFANSFTKLCLSNADAYLK